MPAGLTVTRDRDELARRYGFASSPNCSPSLVPPEALQVNAIWLTVLMGGGSCGMLCRRPRRAQRTQAADEEFYLVARPGLPSSSLDFSPLAGKSGGGGNGGALQLSEDLFDRATRRKLDDHEIQDHDSQQRGNHQKQPADDISEHRSLPDRQRQDGDPTVYDDVSAHPARGLHDDNRHPEVSRGTSPLAAHRSQFVLLRFSAASFSGSIHQLSNPMP